MSWGFYSHPLLQLGIETNIPGKNEVEIINASIYNELGKGIFLAETKQLYIDMIEKYRVKGVGTLFWVAQKFPCY